MLLDVAARDEADGLGDAPWPPHFRKMEGEAARVAPSRAKSAIVEQIRTSGQLNDDNSKALVAAIEEFNKSF